MSYLVFLIDINFTAIASYFWNLKWNRPQQHQVWGFCICI